MSKLLPPKPYQSVSTAAAGDSERTNRRRSQSVSPLRTSSASHGSTSRLDKSVGEGNTGGGASGLSEKQSLKVLQSMGHAVHIIDLEGTIIYWNRSAEILYGYTSSEAIGKDALKLIVDSHDFNAATDIMNRIITGECWTGKFPLKNKAGDRFLAISSVTPFYDDDGHLVGNICVSSDAQSYEDMADPSMHANSRGSSDSPQPRQVAIASKLTHLATIITQKVRPRARMSENTAGQECEGSAGLSFDYECPDKKVEVTFSGPSSSRGVGKVGDCGSTSVIKEDGSPGKSAKYNSAEAEGKLAFHKIISSKAESLFSKKVIPWSWKGEGSNEFDSKNRFVWPWLHPSQDPDQNLPKRSPSCSHPQGTVAECNQTSKSEAVGSWSSLNVNSTSSVSSSGSTSSSVIHKVDLESDCLDYEILWEDLTIGEQIGQGSCGIVYHALWYGSDVAVKVFSKQQYSDEVILSFKQEVSLMKKLRHPNILLFMGAVTSPERLCIVTEYLPRGSLFWLLQKNSTRLDWRRRVSMALDIARGVNYLHHCNPPIIHRDLKSSNLLVDKNWTVKVADFGLSRLKHESFLTTKSGKGTPQWMAPEVLRNEPSDEKSDVYSYGVILWELATQKIPWDHLNQVQVIGAVGFMNQRLELPSDLDPQWASIIESCWHSEPDSRPTFLVLLEKFRDLLRQYAIQSQMQRTSSGDMAKSVSKTNVED